MLDALLAQEPLHALDGVAGTLQEVADALEKLHVSRSVQAPAATALHRFELGEFCFPEAQHVLLDPELHRHLAYVAKCFSCLRQGPIPARIESAYSAALRRLKPELMRCFMMLLGRNTSTRRGVIGTSWPVLGLRPMRSPFLRMPKEPNEESFTAWPAARLDDISFRMSSTSSCDSLRGSPTFWTTASARSARVSVFPPMTSAPSPLHPTVTDANGGVLEGQQQPAEIAHINQRGVDFYQRASAAPQVSPPPMASMS